VRSDLNFLRFCRRLNSVDRRVNLIERLAGRLAQVLLGEFPCREVRVRVRKLTPPMGGLLGIPGVELTRRR